MELGTDRIKRVLSLFSNPQDTIPVIHITGTNGKGSVSALLARIFAAMPGSRVGLFHSPALVEPRDMIHIDGQSVVRPLYEQGLQEIRHKMALQNAQPSLDAGSLHLTDFELHTVLAFLLFSRTCSIAIVEVGMGGRLDATNVIACPLAVLLTSVSLDHTAWLGPTVEDILEHKLDIIRPGRPFLASHQDAASREAIRSMALKRGAHPILFAQKSTLVSDTQDRQTALFSSRYSKAHFEYDTQLLGPYQLINTALAIEAVLYLRDEGDRVACACPWRSSALRKQLDSLSLDMIKEALAATFWPGRLEWLSLPARLHLVQGPTRNLLLDGCHNPAGAVHLASYVRHHATRKGVSHIRWIFALTLGKDFEAIADALFFNPSHAQSIATTTIYAVNFAAPSHMPWIKCWPSTELAEALQQQQRSRSGMAGEQMEILAEEDLFCPLTKYYTADPDTLWVIAGSLYLVSDYYCQIK